MIRRSSIRTVAAERIEQYDEMGVHRIIISPTSFAAAKLAEDLSRFGEEVIQHASV